MPSSDMTQEPPGKSATNAPEPPAAKSPEKIPEKEPAKPEEAMKPQAPERAIPRGMSLNEMRGPDSRAKYFPGAREPVAKQPGTDLVGGNPTQSWTQSGSKVMQTISGGEWISIKRLDDEAKTPVDARVRNAVDQACDKFYNPVRTGVSTRSATLLDGTERTNFTTRLTNPESLLIHIEVPNLSQMPQSEQTRLQNEAQEKLNRWTEPNGTYEGLPIRVQVVEAPHARR